METESVMTNELFLAGAVLIDGEKVLPLIRGKVTEDDFQADAYRAIFTSAVALAGRREAIDPVTIRDEAKRQGVELSNQFIRELMDCTPTAANCADYARRVADDAQVRRIKALAERIQGDDTSGPEELLATIQRETGALRSGTFQRSLLTPTSTLHRFTDYVLEAGQHRNFIPSGFPRLDSILGGGFIRSGLYIVGARPAVGKSTFALNLADSIQGNCLFVSLEMSPEQILAKRVARLTGIPAAKLLNGDTSNADWEKIGVATSFIADRGVFLNSDYRLTVSQIQLLAQAVPELTAVIIDYLGLVQPATRGGSTYEAVSGISRELKVMAATLNVPVICLCQLSRSVEGREDKRPRLSDLRDSGAIEQDADGVLLLYRPDYYTGATPGAPSLVSVEVAKNRHGATGQTEFNFWLNSSSFKEVGT